MLILKVDPIVRWAERIDRCTVRGARITQGPFKQFASTCDAAGNSTSLSRKWTCLESQAGVLKQRSSEDAKVRILVSKDLNRRRRRGLGRSKKIPDISREYGSPRARLQVGGKWQRQRSVAAVLLQLAADPVIAQ